MNEPHNDTMDCTDIKALLSALVDDELAADQRHHAERHLTDCEGCRGLLSDAERYDALVAAAVADGPAGLPDGFEQAVLRRTVHAGRRPDAARGWLGWFAAAAIFIMGVTLWIIDHGARRAAEPSGEVMQATYPTGPEVKSWPLDEPRADGVEASAWPSLVINEVAVYPPDEPVYAARSGSESASVTTVAVLPRELDPRGRVLSRESAETIDAASMLLAMFEQGDDHSFSNVERVRRIAEYDDLLGRLADARDQLPAKDRPVIRAAESMLFRIVRGPLSLDDVKEMRHDIARLDLPKQIDAINGRMPTASSL